GTTWISLLRLKNQSIVSDLLRAGSVAQQLEQQGVTILSVITRQGKPCIHVARNSYCDALIQEGKASYQYFNSIRVNKACSIPKVAAFYWSESIH
ncbi:hypothetical protein CFT61_16410, partial [Segatella copri]